MGKKISIAKITAKKLKAVFKDDAVRCEKCGVEIWEGVDCDCGVDGADHEGLKEAYAEKENAEYEEMRDKEAEEAEKNPEIDFVFPRNLKR